MKLFVYPLPKNVRLIHNSPFCSKAMIFLKMNQLDHELIEFKGNPASFPNGKLPVLEDGEEVIPDSEYIQKYLIEKSDLKIDAHLNEEQKAVGFFLLKSLEEYFYWILLHERWHIDSNWNRMKDDYFAHFPSLMRGMITKSIRKSALKSSLAQGVSRHGDEKVLERGVEFLKYLSQILGEKNFIFGEISSFDSSLYAFISSIIHSPYGPVLQKDIQQYANLLEYDERMYNKVFT